MHEVGQESRTFYYRKGADAMKDFLKENWQTIVVSAVTTIVYRLLTGW